MPSAEERLAHVHPNALKQVSKNPVYVSAKRQEFIIEHKERGMYRIRPWHGGIVANDLKGTFTSFKAAEAVLIAWLKRTDKFGNRAVYPDYG